MKTVIKIPDPQGEYAPLVYKISNLEIRHTVLGECDISNSTSKIIVIKTSEENLLGTIITDNLLDGTIYRVSSLLTVNNYSILGLITEEEYQKNKT